MMLDLLARARDGEGVKSGPIGLAAILVLCVACYFLFKSMSKHLKRVREEFPVDEPVVVADPSAGTGDMHDAQGRAQAPERTDSASSGTSSTTSSGTAPPADS